MTSVVPDRPVTRDDIEAKLREIRGDVDEVAGEARNIGMMVGVAVVALVVVGAYLIGRRRGRNRQTIVEIRRV